METHISTPFTQIPQTLQSLIRRIEADKPTKPSQLRQMLLQTDVTPEDLEPWIQFDHPAEDSYGRQLVYEGDGFEVMVMSWNPGDISAIHDHGYTQWGAVKVFGTAEHAVFIVQDNHITTLNRIPLKAGQVLGVGHDMIHQMGAPLDGKPMISLHVYGANDREKDITAESRLYNLAEGQLLHVNGGAFFNADPATVVHREQAPATDFATRLRDQVEAIRRSKAAGLSTKVMEAETFASGKITSLLADLEEVIDENGHVNNSTYWQHLCSEIQQAALLQEADDDDTDHFDTYAALYDSVIGQPCLENFMANYLAFFKEKYDLDFSTQTMLSVGCGTGLVERYMIDEMGLQYGNMLGFDLSPAMVGVASRRIPAEEGNALNLDPNIRQWNLVYSGLNVLQYIGHEHLHEVIRKIASVTTDGGYFIGDFITPDHIRWYPNVMRSKDRKIVSLRTPKLVEKNQHTYQRSHILNVDATGQRLRITDEGLHDRFLPPLHRIRQYFNDAFAEVELYDAVHLTPIDHAADTCPSTRYIVVARK